MNIQGLEKIFAECVEIGKKKNADYGGTMDNIALTGVHGIAVRLVDKVTRAHNLSRDGVTNQVKDESLRDTFKDMINYAAYAIMLMDGTWKGEGNTLLEVFSKDIAKANEKLREMPFEEIAPYKLK